MKKITALLFLLVASILIAALFDANPLYVGIALITIGAFAPAQKGVLNMAIVAIIVDIRGKAYQPIIEELLFGNKTVSEKLVAFEDNVKANTIFTENVNVATMQAYTAGAPASAGSLGIVDTLITPLDVMFYQEFNPRTLRPSRFNSSMKQGAWNSASSEFEKVVLGSYGDSISYDCELKFWTAISTATQTAIAALTPGVGQASVGAAEQSWAAAQTPAAWIPDGIVARLIYNGGALGKRVKVLGTTITSANIATEYAKIYAAIPPVVLSGQNAVVPYIYAPYSHRQLINIYNISATYRDLFMMDLKSGKAYYNGIEIKFVPLPENCMICSRPDYLVWCTDSLNDINYMEVNKVANNQDMMFVKSVLTQFAHVVNQRYITLYLG